MKFLPIQYIDYNKVMYENKEVGPIELLSLVKTFIL